MTDGYSEAHKDDISTEVRIIIKREKPKLCERDGKPCHTWKAWGYDQCRHGDCHLNCPPLVKNEIEWRKKRRQ